MWEGSARTQVAGFIVLPQNSTSQENSSQSSVYQICSQHAVDALSIERAYFILSIKLLLFSLNENKYIMHTAAHLEVQRMEEDADWSRIWFTG